MKTEKIIECLNDLLTKAYDAEEGFNQAAERATEHPTLASFFREQSSSRRDFGHDIKGAITRHGGEPDKGSSVAAKAHQIWITVKDTLSSDDDAEAILEECVRGEKTAIDEYEEFLKTPDLPVDVRELVTNQKLKISDTLNTIIRKEEAAD